MKKSTSFSLVLSLIIFATSSNAHAFWWFTRDSHHKAIYRGDSRVEVHEYPDDSIRDMASGVAGMVRSFRLLERDPYLRRPTVNDRNNEIEMMLIDQDKSSIHKSIESLIRSYESKKEAANLASSELLDDQYYYFDIGRTMKRNMNVCAGERFIDQPVLPDCTGFLIADDLLVTAGHCVETEYQCRNFRWAFGFVDGVTRLERSDVYSCVEIVEHSLATTSFITKDYSIIRLDRPVLGREPLPIRTEGRISAGEELAVIGHPTGLPMKIADNATVQNSRINFFYSDLDTFSGNSGSPVIGVHTGQVEGILVEGEEDFEFVTDRRCYVPRRFYSTRSSGGKEKVYRINRIPNIEDFID